MDQPIIVTAPTDLGFEQDRYDGNRLLSKINKNKSRTYMKVRVGLCAAGKEALATSEIHSCVHGQRYEACDEDEFRIYG
jgi:hypothetical protein